MHSQVRLLFYLSVHTNQTLTSAFRVENKLVFNTHINDLTSKERLWFMCGYSDSTLIVIARGSPSEELLISSGMLIDLRNIPTLHFPASFFDHALHRLSSTSERIRLCNQIRDLLSTRSRYRWCGAQLESIFHSEIVKNACEINGLAILGRAVNEHGIISGSLPEIMTTNHSCDVFQHLESISDDGQRKLAAIMHSFAIAHTTIVYVGSAPGTGWLSALEFYPNIERVISIDPRPLASSNARVNHIQEMLRSNDHLFDLTGFHRNCVLIWDVRSDSEDGTDRDQIILDEIFLLNTISNDPRLESHFLAMHIKINMRHICQYELPIQGRFFLQPYTLQRDVYEARYVVHLRSGVPLSLFSPSAFTRAAILREMEETQERLEDGLLSEGHLVANLMCSRIRNVNYIEREAYNSSIEEICLFTINHNSPSSVLHYLSGLKQKKINYIISPQCDSGGTSNPLRLSTTSNFIDKKNNMGG